MRILFFGTDHFSLASLRRIHGAQNGKLWQRLEVVTPAPAQRWRSNSRRPPTAQGVVRGFAEEHGLKIYDAPNSRSIKPCADDWVPSPQDIRANFDVGVVVSFGFFLPAEVIDAFPLGALNVHPSMLPKYRGAAPIQHCLMNGDKETGVTVQRVDPRKFDAGAILSQETAAVEPHDTFLTLSERLAEQGAGQLQQVLEQMQANSLLEREQTNEGVTFAPKIKPQNRVISFGDMTASEIYNKWRGLVAHGGIAAEYQGKSLKLHELTANPEVPTNTQPGEFFSQGGLLFAACKDGSVVQLESVQLEGKKRVSGTDFANGHVKK